MWEYRGEVGKGKKESFLLVRPLLDHFAGFVWSTKIGCRDGLSEHLQGDGRARDVVVSPVCAKPYALKRGRSRDAAWWPQAKELSAIYIRQKLVFSLRQKIT